MTRSRETSDTRRWLVQRVALLSVLAALLALGASERVAAAQSWPEARAAHEAHKYADAIKHYEGLAQAGVRHEALFYNLGNAYFRSGQFGQSVFNFERAVRLSPGFADARHNLRLARAAVQQQHEGRIPAAESVRSHALARGRAEALLLRGAELSSLGRVSIAFLCFNVVFFLGLIVVRLIRRGFAHALLVVANVFSGFGAVACGALLAAHIHYASLTLGVVLPGDVVLHEAPSARAASTGRAYAGLRVRLLARDSGWLKLRLASGTEGWVSVETIGELR